MLRKAAFDIFKNELYLKKESQQQNLGLISFFHQLVKTGMYKSTDDTKIDIHTTNINMQVIIIVQIII